MTKPRLKRRMAANEVIFREYNEHIQLGYDEIKKVAVEDGQQHVLVEYDVPMEFFCECSDENCRKRILLKPSDYQKIHKNRSRFVVMVGHEEKNIENVVERNAKFSIVEKFVPIPTSPAHLRQTHLTENI